jgi:hypothetical protein
MERKVRNWFWGSACFSGRRRHQTFAVALDSLHRTSDESTGQFGTASLRYGMAGWLSAEPTLRSAWLSVSTRKISLGETK